MRPDEKLLAFMKENDIQETDIVNFELFNKYYKLKTGPILSVPSVKSSLGEDVFFNKTKNIFNAAISNLPIPEQRMMERRWTAYKKFFNQALVTARQCIKRERVHDFKNDRRGKIYQGTLSGRKEELIELFGAMYSIKEVHVIVLEEWGIKVDITVLKEFRRKFHDVIQTKIEAHKRDHSDVRLGIKRSRLLELAYLYNTSKNRYKARPSRNEAELLMKLLNQFKVEVEGDLDVRVSGDIAINVEHSLEAHARHILSREFHLMEIIVCTVATRLGVKPMLLLERLNKSYYSKFALLNGEAPPPSEEIELPSKENIEFRELKARHEVSKRAEESKLYELDPSHFIVLEKTKDAEGVKDALFEKLQDKKKVISDKRALVEKYPGPEIEGAAEDAARSTRFQKIYQNKKDKLTYHKEEGKHG